MIISLKQWSRFAWKLFFFNPLFLKLYGTRIIKQKPFEISITGHPNVLLTFGKVLEDPVNIK